MTPALPVPAARSGHLSMLGQFAAIPKEEIWSAIQKSKQTDVTIRSTCG